MTDHERTRVAAIDMGSNGIRMLVVDDDGHGGFEVVASQRAAIRLGTTTFTTGRLDPIARAEATAAVDQFATKLRLLGNPPVRAVATSAVRDAKDGASFLRAVQKQTGIQVEAISGSEESRLVHRAVVERAPLGDVPWIVADLGGGSLEIALCDAHRIHWSESRQIGTVRLLGQHRDDPADQMAQRIAQHLEDFRILHVPDKLAIGGLVVCGGNSNALARMVGEEPRDGDPVALARTDLAILVSELSEVMPNERMRRWGFRPDRADVILPAALVYQRVADLLGVDVVHVTGWGVREGIVLDLLDERLRPHQRDQRMSVGVHHAALALGNALRFDRQHGEEVADLALSLFDQLQPLHRMKMRDRHVLLAASILHEVGRALGENGHHKHSMYLIQNAELSGLAAPDVALAGVVARYHRGALPRDGHPGYSELGEKDRRRVDRLAGILRITDALCQARPSRVAQIAAEATPDKLYLRVRTRPGATAAADVRCARTRADLLRRAVGRDVIVEEGP